MNPILKLSVAPYDVMLAPKDDAFNALVVFN